MAKKYKQSQQGFSRSTKWVVIGFSSIIILSMVLGGISAVFQ